MGDELRGRVVGNTIVLDGPSGLREGDRVVVRVEKVEQKERKPRVPGLLKGKVWMADDFNDTPPGFEEYMP